MLKKKTLLVLGAGASAPYDFPLGRNLILNIIRQWSEQTSGQPNVVSRCATLKLDLEGMRELSCRLDESSTPSIDVFLDTKENRDLLGFGKAAIALEISKYELARRFNLSDKAIQDHWYALLWNAMLDHSSADLFGQNQLRVITFNYDRSLEHYLSSRVKGFYRLSDDATQETMGHFDFCHVHGSLCRHPCFGGDNCRRYEQIDNAGELARAVNSIRILGESMHDSPELYEARKWFQWAELVCFFGFGFQSMNLDLLFPNAEYLKLSGWCGSAKEMTLKQRQNIQQELVAFSNLGNPNLSVGNVDTWDTSQCITQWALF